MLSTTKAEIITNNQLVKDICCLRLMAPDIARKAAPGQFVNIRCSQGTELLLRRPISICRVDRENGILELVYQVKGKGTDYLSKVEAGGKLDLLGPLGKGFGLLEGNKRIAVAGGGIGIFPLLFLIDEYKRVNRNIQIDSFLGFRSKEYACCLELFEQLSDALYLATEDGSLGQKGFVTGSLGKAIGEKAYDMLYTCGPAPMLKKVTELAKSHSLKTQVSLEERMGCGIGACLVCACKTKHGEDWEYSHVCKDGPVFDAEEVLFE